MRPALINNSWLKFASAVANTGSYNFDPVDLMSDGNDFLVLVASTNGDWDVSDWEFCINCTDTDSDGIPDKAENEIDYLDPMDGSDAALDMMVMA